MELLQKTDQEIENILLLFKTEKGWEVSIPFYARVVFCGELETKKLAIAYGCKRYREIHEYGEHHEGYTRRPKFRRG